VILCRTEIKLTMKSLVVLPLLSFLELASGFSPAMQHPLMVAASSRSSGKIMGTASSTTTSQLYSSQWDDEDVEAEAKESATTTTRSTFYEAGDSLREEDDKEKLDGMGDYDSNPAVRYDWDLNFDCCAAFNPFGLSLFFPNVGWSCGWRVCDMWFVVVSPQLNI
jgi:hypothetical protein